MIAGSVARREAEARVVLEAVGVAGQVRSLGPDGEIAAVSGPGTSLAVVQGIAPRLRSLGYRYVALDLGAEGPMQQGAE